MHPRKDMQTMRLKTENKHLTPDPHSLSPSLKAIMKFEGGGNPP